MLWLHGIDGVHVAADPYTCPEMQKVAVTQSTTLVGRLVHWPFPGSRSINTEQSERREIEEFSKICTFPSLRPPSSANHWYYGTLDASTSLASENTFCGYLSAAGRARHIYRPTYGIHAHHHGGFAHRLQRRVLMLSRSINQYAEIWLASFRCSP